MEKDKCTKCKSENLTLERIRDIDDDGKVWVMDSWDAHCNDCGWDFILIDM